MADITSWKEKAERARAALARVREHAEDAVVNLRTDAETLGSAAAVGFMKGMVEANGKQFAVGSANAVPGELIIGLGLKALAYSKVGGKATEDIHALGNGPLAYLAGSRAYEAAKNRAVKKA